MAYREYKNKLGEMEGEHYDPEAPVLKDEQVVLVTYPDNTNRYTIVGELKELFDDELTGWKDWFFEELLTKGEANGRFANYKLIK